MTATLLVSTQLVVRQESPSPPQQPPPSCLHTKQPAAAASCWTAQPTRHAETCRRLHPLCARRHLRCAEHRIHILCHVCEQQTEVVMCEYHASPFYSSAPPAERPPPPGWEDNTREIVFVIFVGRTIRETTSSSFLTLILVALKEGSNRAPDKPQQHNSKREATTSATREPRPAAEPKRGPASDTSLYSSNYRAVTPQSHRCTEPRRRKKIGESSETPQTPSASTLGQYEKTCTRHLC